MQVAAEMEPLQFGEDMLGVGVEPCSVLVEGVAEQNFRSEARFGDGTGSEKVDGLQEGVAGSHANVDSRSFWALKWLVQAEISSVM